MPGVTENFLAIAWALVPLMAYLNLRLGVVTMQRGEASTNFFAFLFGILFFSAIARDSGSAQLVRSSVGSAL